MRLDMTPEPLADDDATIRAHLEGLPVVALLTTVAHATGDLSLLREDLRPDLTKMLAPDDGYDATQLETARRLAADALARIGPVSSKTERKRAEVLAVKVAAEALGNTPTVAKSSYIDPRVFTRYRRGQVLDVTVSPESAIRTLLLG